LGAVTKREKCYVKKFAKHQSSSEPLIDGHAIVPWHPSRCSAAFWISKLACGCSVATNLDALNEEIAAASVCRRRIFALLQRW